MRKERNTFQRKEQDKSLRENLNDVEIGNVHDKEFKVMVIKMITKLMRRMDEHRNSRDRKYKKVPSKSHKAKEYNN